MNFCYDVLNYKYPSRREVIYGRKGMVCTSQSLAAQAGLDIIKAGGNAVDAALATASCMIVLEPTSNGFGSDAFAQVWMDGKLYGLNASGFSPALLTREALMDKGYEQMPKFGWEPVTVPGAVSGWKKLHDRFGTLSWEKIFEPAIRYAEEGYVVTPVISKMWRQAWDDYEESLSPELFEEWRKVFAPDGHTPRAGEIWSSKAHAETFRELAATDCESLYRGRLADEIDSYSRTTGGYLRKGDLVAYEAEWVQPVSTSYRGYDVWEIPPNGHGIVALMALNIMECMQFAAGHDSEEVVHRQLEAMKLAYSDGQQYIADSRSMKVTTEQMLSKVYAAYRAANIGQRAAKPQYGNPASGGTIYLCTADGAGNMVSFIQSNYCNFGSGIVVPKTGIALQNRGFNFYMDPESANCVGPHKKTYHTIIPGFLTRNGKAIGPFGVMGGFMQPQGHVQVMMNLIDFHMNPQEALDAPRWQWTGDMNIEIEQGFPMDMAGRLKARGHHVTVATDSMDFGRGQLIFRDENGILTGATEPRAGGAVAAW